MSMFIYTLSDIFGLFIFGLMVFIYLCMRLPELVKQYFCKHEKYSETSSCDAICKSCGKNLGFIGNVRKKDKL